jgi:hypothetical protein
MYMVEATAGAWTIGVMANVFVQWIDEYGARGDDHFGSVNWIMGMARRGVGAGELRGKGDVQPRSAHARDVWIP